MTELSVIALMDSKAKLMDAGGLIESKNEDESDEDNNCGGRVKGSKNYRRRLSN